MKFTSAVAVFAFIVPFAVAASDQVPLAPPPPSLACPDPYKADPLYRAYSSGGTNHFYTADKGEMDHATTSLGYSAEGITGYIFPTHEVQTVPLYRCYQGPHTDHLYTTNKAESDNAVANLGYTYEGIVGYVYPPSGSSCPGAAPWYRTYQPSAVDHFYTMSAPEMVNAVINLGYSNEGVAAYIMASRPPPPPQCPDPYKAVPLYRAYSAGGTNHFYTTNKGEMDHATTSLGYSAEGITGYIFPTHEVKTIPLYRCYQGPHTDHLYTTNKAESDNAVANLGYTYEGIAGYVYPPSGSSCPGAAPWYRTYQPSAVDHFYTMSAPEMINAVTNLGYSNEGIAAYILVSH